MAILLQSCATIWRGDQQRVEFRGGNSILAFYLEDGRPLKAYHESHDAVHYHYLDLDRGVQQYHLLASDGSKQYEFLLARQTDYYWYFINIFPTYGLGVLVDYGTGAIYSFRDQRIDTLKAMPATLAGPIVRSSLEEEHEIAEREKARDKKRWMLVDAYLGVPLTSEQPPQGPGCVGAGVGVKLTEGLYAELGYDACGLSQWLGPKRKVWDAWAFGPSVSLAYYPLHKYFYLAPSLSYTRLNFERGFRDTTAYFSTQQPTASLSIGFDLGGVMLEWRRTVGLHRFDTPEGPSHSLGYSRFSFGARLHVAPWEE